MPPAIMIDVTVLDVDGADPRTHAARPPLREQG
jgi:hypothetical protein